jgi:hypothetical protein
MNKDERKQVYEAFKLLKDLLDKDEPVSTQESSEPIGSNTGEGPGPRP